MRIYNTLSGKKEKLAKPKNRPLRLFVCGPTVYDFSHIGHARTYLFFDTLVRYLRHRGLKVFYLQNITDIDDKIINRSKEEKISPAALAKKYEKAYHEDEKKIGISSVSKYARASDYMPQIVKQIQTLVRKGHAYEIEGDGYYFDLSTFPEYGKLSKRTAQQAEDAVSRIDEGIGKRNKGDFALWKHSKPGEPFWDTPLGKGRPGWHIEDTAISEHHFGPQYDLHGGAVDLKFPHHESEIAQQESASGKKPFVKIWMHTGFLTVKGEKMSKSLGNFVTIRKFLESYEAAVLKLIILNYHYRSPLDYNGKSAESFCQAWNNICGLMANLHQIYSRKSGAGSPDKHSRRNKKSLELLEKKFFAALEDDFNTPKAMAALFDIISLVRTGIGLDAIAKRDARDFYNRIKELLKILGLPSEITAKIPGNIKKLVEKRELSRTNKQFIQADRLRKKIQELGYKVEDTAFGPLVRKKFRS